MDWFVNLCEKEIIIIILFVVACFAVGFSIPIIISTISYINRRKVRIGILKEKRSLLAQGKWFPVTYCDRESPQWFKGGIFLITNNSITFWGRRRPKAKEITLHFNLKDIKVKWKGAKWMLKKGLWFTITLPYEEHYFTYDTGALLFGEKAKTKKIYQILQERLRLIRSQ